MTFTPALSVIMPLYNSAPFVVAAVESVLAQSFADFEFLIIDDGSTDGSGDIVAEIAQRDPRVTLFRQENQGIVPSINFLLDRVRAPFVARMDSDDICFPDRFARQLAYFAEHPAVGALGTQFIEIDAADRVIDDGFRHPVGVAEVAAALIVTQPVGNPTAMFRTKVLRAVNGYRPAFRYCEDYDLFLRLSRYAAIDNLPDVLMYYRRSPGQMSIKHNSSQTRQAVKALFAHREVLAGRADPFDGLQDMPTIAEMDRLFGRVGVGDEIRQAIAERLRFSPMALAGDEFSVIAAHAASGRSFAGGWRTVARCLRFGLFGRAARLCGALTRGHVARWRGLA